VRTDGEGRFLLAGSVLELPERFYCPYFLGRWQSEAGGG